MASEAGDAPSSKHTSSEAKNIVSETHLNRPTSRIAGGKPQNVVREEQTHESEHLRPTSLRDVDNIRVTINGAKLSKNGNFTQKYCMGTVFVSAPPCVSDVNSPPPERWYEIVPNRKRPGAAFVGQVLIQFQIRRRDIGEGALPPTPVKSPWASNEHKPKQYQMSRYRVQLGCFKLAKLLGSIRSERVTMTLQVSRYNVCVASCSSN